MIPAAPLPEHAPQPRRMRPAGQRLCVLQFQHQLQADAGDLSRAGCASCKQVPAACCGCWKAIRNSRENLRREARGAGRGGRTADLRADDCRWNTHLARLTLADLFLDCLPYNAHTTASDALWAGVPLLTCRGTAFPGRVAASLLNAIGLAELIAENLADYESLAVTLAGDADRLASLRQKLAANRGTTPLFDTARYCRHVEAAYTPSWWRRMKAKG